MTLLRPSEQRGIDRLVEDGALAHLPTCPQCGVHIETNWWENHLTLFCPKTPTAESKEKE